jgi:hypothetical protein
MSSSVKDRGSHPMTAKATRRLGAQYRRPGSRVPRAEVAVFGAVVRNRSAARSSLSPYSGVRSAQGAPRASRQSRSVQPRWSQSVLVTSGLATAHMISAARSTATQCTPCAAIHSRLGPGMRHVCPSCSLPKTMRAHRPGIRRPAALNGVSMRRLLRDTTELISGSAAHVRREVRVDLLHGHRALAHRRGDALH